MGGGFPLGDLCRVGSHPGPPVCILWNQVRQAATVRPPALMWLPAPPPARLALLSAAAGRTASKLVMAQVGGLGWR